MFDVPGSSIRGVYINEDVVTGSGKAQYVTSPIEEREETVDDGDGDGGEAFVVEENGTRTTA